MSSNVFSKERLASASRAAMDLALEEDIASLTDISTEAMLESLRQNEKNSFIKRKKYNAKATLKAKQDMLICGISCIPAMLEQLIMYLSRIKKADFSSSLSLLGGILPRTSGENSIREIKAEDFFEWNFFCQDADHLRKNTSILEIRGPLALLLLAERPILNLCMKLSGIATLTSKYVAALAGPSSSSSAIQISDTRKTTPGLRFLEKYAVHVGGGENHRMGLYDHYLIKDNHIDILGDIAIAIQAAVKHRENFRKNEEKRLRTGLILDRCIEIECRSIHDVQKALKFLSHGLESSDFLLLDNFTNEMIVKACRIVEANNMKSNTKSGDIPGQSIHIEVSGNMDIHRVRSLAKIHHHHHPLPLRRISVGSLTHSAPAVDISCQVIEC